MYASAAEVRWEEHATEEAAACREADLLVAAPPPYNAAGSSGGWTDVVLGGRRYGCFPHLGPGLASVPGTACTDGFAALLRLLWAAGDPAAPVPAKPSIDRLPRLPHDLHRPLHDLLTGTSRRALDHLLALAGEAVEPYRLPALRRDRATAEGFFVHGPVRLRELRRRHRLGSGYVDRERLVAALTAELRHVLGPDVVLIPPPDPTLLGRRDARSLRRTTAPPPAPPP